MLTPDYLENVANDAVKLYAKLENTIIRDIARRIVTAGVMTETARHQIKAIQQSGELYDEIIKEIASITHQSDRVIRKIFEDAVIESLKYDDKVYKAAGLNPIPLAQSPNLLQTLTAGLIKTQKDINNLIMTSAGNAQAKFVSTVNMAYMQVTSGAFDYNTAIFNAVEQLSKDGIDIVYPSGKTDKIDVAVRRAVLTGVNQTACKLQEERADEMGCDLVEVSAHAGARVTKQNDHTNHSWWQGKVYSRGGKSDKYPDFKKTTGYGKVDGLGGINCRHSFYPFFEGLSKRNYTDEELEEINNKTVTYEGKEYNEYEALQMQRKKERNIRAMKRDLASYEEIMLNGDESLAEQARMKFNKKAYDLKNAEKELKEFSERTGLKRDRARERVAGFDRGFSNRVIKAEKDFKKQKEYDIIPNKENEGVEKDMQYIDVTNEMYKNAKPNKGKVEKQKFYEDDGKIYRVDGHNVVYKHDERELEVARLLNKTFGGKVKILPNINFPQGIKSPDYLFRGEKTDLKRITSKRANDCVKTALRNKEEQADNFIIDNTAQTVTDDAIIKQIGEIFNSKGFLWIDKIYLLKGNSFIKVFKRK